MRRPLSVQTAFRPREALAEARVESARIRARMIAEQEELDWEVYRLYGLVDEDLTYRGDDLPGLALGERAFEIALARAVANGEEETAWFDRHGSTPITEIPAHWPAGVPGAGAAAARPDREPIRTSGCWRSRSTSAAGRQEPWEKRQERALRDWLLDRLEDRRLWFDPQGRPRPRSVAQLADDVSRDPDLVSVLALWEGRPDMPVTQSLTRLLADEAVPFLAAYRYKDTGLRKREAWEETWALQRREDAGENVGTIPVPPKYAPADFRKTSYWQARGKLDVPKERFILYPDAGRETDPTALLGWAGWDHAQQSLALLGHHHRPGEGRLAGRPAHPAGRRAGRAPALGGAVARRDRPRLQPQPRRVLPRAADRSRCPGRQDHPRTRRLATRRPHPRTQT